MAPAPARAMPQRSGGGDLAQAARRYTQCVRTLGIAIRLVSLFFNSFFLPHGLSVWWGNGRGLVMPHPKRASFRNELLESPWVGVTRWRPKWGRSWSSGWVFRSVRVTNH